MNNSRPTFVAPLGQMQRSNEEIRLIFKIEGVVELLVDDMWEQFPDVEDLDTSDMFDVSDMLQTILQMRDHVDFVLSGNQETTIDQLLELYQYALEVMDRCSCMLRYFATKTGSI